MKSKIMMRGLSLLLLGTSVYSTPFENKVTAADTALSKLHECKKEILTLEDNAFTERQKVSAFKTGLDPLAFSPFAQAIPAVGATAGTPQKPTATNNQGASEEVGNYVLSLYTKESTHRAGILALIKTLFCEMFANDLTILNTAEKNAEFQDVVKLKSIKDAIQVDLNADIAPTVTGEALANQQTANAKAAAAQAQQIALSMINKRIELVKPADEARQAVEAAKAKEGLAEKTLQSIPNADASSFTAPTAQAENVAQTIKGAIKEFWKNGGMAKNALMAVLFCMCAISILVTAQQGYNAYAILNNVWVSVKP